MRRFKLQYQVQRAGIAGRLITREARADQQKLVILSAWDNSHQKGSGKANNVHPVSRQHQNLRIGSSKVLHAGILAAGRREVACIFWLIQSAAPDDNEVQAYGTKSIDILHRPLRSTVILFEILGHHVPVFRDEYFGSKSLHRGSKS